MHKIFAKTLFLGKRVVYLQECLSTNRKAMELVADSACFEGTIVLTDNQTNGKGQRGNTWISSPGKNLTCTIILKPAFLEISNQFSLTVMVSLAVRDLFQKYLPEEKVTIKWPNDIYVGEKKCAGILIENVIKGKTIEYSFVGLGININQQHFSLTKAASLFHFSGIENDLDNMLEETLLMLEGYYLQLKKNGKKSLMPKYLSHLHWKEELRHFESEGKSFQGKILGVDHFGQLVVETLGEQRAFDIKEITFLK